MHRAGVRQHQPEHRNEEGFPVEGFDDGMREKRSREAGWAGRRHRKATGTR